MEIKEINELTNMFLIQNGTTARTADKNNLAANLKKGVSGSEFINMLKQQSNTGIRISAETDAEGDFAASSAPVDRTSGRVVSDKDVRVSGRENKTTERNERNQTASDNKKTKPEDDRTDNKEASASSSSSQAKDEPVSSAGNETKGDKTTVEKAENNGGAKAEAAENGDISETQNGMQTENGETTETAENTRMLIDELLGMLSALGIQVSGLDELAQMPSVTVYNGLTGEYTEMSGTELLSSLTQQDNLLVPVMPQDNSQADIALYPVEEITRGLEEKGVDISSLTPVVQKVIESVKQPEQQMQTAAAMPESAEEVAPEAEIRNVQAAELESLLPEDKKLSVSVKVHEENFAYDSADDVVSDAVKTLTTEQKTVPSANIAANTNMQQTPVAAAPVAAQTAPAGENNMDNLVQIAVKGVKEAGSNVNTLSHSGAEAAQLARAEQTAVADAKNSSFRDVYKGMSREVIEQVKVNITKSAVKGVDKIEIQLKPEDLGHIEIKMQISKDGKLQAHIISSRAETMDILQKDMSSLEKAFNDAGFNTDEGSFSFSFRGRDADRENSQQALRSFLGDMLEQGADNDELFAEAAAGENWDGKSALNIRV